MANKFSLPDVDLDVADRPTAVGLFPTAVRASQLSAQGDKFIPHNTGLYLQQVPTDPLNGLASFPFKTAEDLGYFKIDILPNSVYQLVENEDQLNDLMALAQGDFPWECLLDESFYNSDDPDMVLTHLGGHYDVVTMYPPQSVLDVAALLALIRPRKKYLIGEPWKVIEDKIWKNIPEEEKADNKGAYFFKKSHAVAFALLVLVHAQLIALSQD